jgi:hypothetical protein
MNEEELDAMDQLIAEKLMGWEIVDHKLYQRPGPCGSDAEIEALRLVGWSPTRDRAAAMEAQAQILIKGYAIGTMYRSEGIFVAFDLGNLPMPRTTGFYANTLELAISHLIVSIINRKGKI